MSFCFQSAVLSGTAVQFTVPQPVDLALDVQGNGIRLRIDGFDIGKETVTLLGGEFMVQIVPVDQTVLSSLIVSRKSISLQEAAKFRQAENLATETKQTQTENGIRDSLSLWQDLGDSSAIARTQLKFGYYWHKQGQFETARQAYETAARLCDALEDLRCRTEAVNNSGVESRRLADFDSARNNLQEAARGWKMLGDSPNEAVTFANLGSLYRTIHEYQRALSFDERAAEILKKLDKVGFARVLNDFGLCYQSLGEYRRAKEYFARALRIEKSVSGNQPDLARFEINLGRTLLSMGQSRAASILLLHAKDLADSRAERSAIADASTNLGEAFLAQGLTSKAKTLFVSALMMHQILKDRRFIAADQHFLGLVAVRENRSEEAKSRFVEAASLRSQLNLRLDAGESYYELAQLELQAENFGVANDLAQRSLKFTEGVRVEVSSPALRGSFSSARRKIIDLLINIEVSQGGNQSAERSLLIAEQGQGRAILDLLAEGRLLGSPTPDMQEKKKSINRQIGMLSEQMLNASEIRLETLRRQASMLIAQGENIDAQIRELQPEQKFGHPLDSVERLRSQLLPAGTALLEFHLGEPKSYLWLVTSHSLNIFKLPAQKQLDRDTREFVSLFERVQDRKRSPELQKQFKDATQRVSRELLKDLKGEHLPDTLILVCDGSLHRLPFEALTIPGSSQAIGLEHNLIRVPSAGFLEAGSEARPVSEFPKSFLGVVDPVFSQTDSRLRAFAATKPARSELPRLPFTFELDTVDRLVKPSMRSTLRGLQATKGRLEKSDLENYAILHLSTHAIMDDTEPELSRVALSLVDARGRTIDGYLHPSQFAAWRLSGSTVVLSACETALGKQVMGEGLWGLTAALFEAGAGQLVLTLAPVDAEGSSEFFGHVYRGIFGRKPVSMERALTNARKSLAMSSRWSDPYYWASFVTIGRPTGEYNQGTL